MSSLLKQRHQRKHTICRHHTTAVDFDFNFSTPKLESPLSAELSGNIFAMLARLSSAQSNAQLLVTTVAEHAATSDIVDLLEAHQDNEVTWSRQGKRIHVNVGRGSSPVLQLKGQAYMAPFRGWAASHLHLMKRTAAVPKAEGSLEQVRCQSSQSAAAVCLSQSWLSPCTCLLLRETYTLLHPTKSLLHAIFCSFPALNLMK